MIRRMGKGSMGTKNVAFVALIVGASLAPTAAEGQFGLQERADAASRMIVLGVQQGISSLPPTSGQSLTYEFDPELSTFVASERLGATSFRSAQTIGKGKWSLRASYSYFELSDSFGPIKYAVDVGDPPTVGGVAELGLDADAKVNLINLGTNYGVTDRLEVFFNVPVTVVDANAAQLSSTRQSIAGVPPDMAVLSGPILRDSSGFPIPFSNDPAIRQQQIDQLSDDFDRLLTTRGGGCQVNDPLTEECLVLRRDSVDDLGGDFVDGSAPGVGRISLGVKYLFLAMRYLHLAASLEFFNPSPSEDEYAGSASPAILPRLIGELPLHDHLRLHVDAGYDYDFDVAELRRFVWNAGASVPISRWVTIDFGAGGSEFDVPIRWTPTQATNPPQPLFPNTTTITALDNNKLGDSFVDFLGGFKVRATDTVVLSGSVTTPLTSDGFRADAVGTVAIEAYY